MPERLSERRVVSNALRPQVLIMAIGGEAVELGTPKGPERCGRPKRGAFACRDRPVLFCSVRVRSKRGAVSVMVDIVLLLRFSNVAAAVAIASDRLWRIVVRMAGPAACAFRAPSFALRAASIFSALRTHAPARLARVQAVGPRDGPARW